MLALNYDHHVIGQKNVRRAWGGSGPFTALGGGNVDTIGDFQVGIDEILLENAVFTGLAAGALGAGAFRTGAAPWFGSRGGFRGNLRGGVRGNSRGGFRGN